MINSHTHCMYSSDSNAQLDDICKIAIERGLEGFAITDHVAFWCHENGFDPTAILACKKEVFELRQKYKGKLKILFGMEIGEHHFNPSYEKQALGVGDVDVVLCSLHDTIPLSTRPIKTHFITNDFTCFTYDEQIEILKNYYSILKDNASKYDYDILSHITYPFRYFCIRDKINIDWRIVEKEIIQLLSIVIERGKALELNTSNASEGFFMPNETILKLYKEMGGELITLGSDAHVAERIDHGLKEGKQLLKKCGFTKYYYYENRQPKIAEIL